MVSEVETNPTDFADHAGLHALLVAAFAGMADRIDPPSSLTRMDVRDVAAKIATEDLLLIRDHGAPVACLFGVARPDCYYIGKLAAASDYRRRGLARRLVEAAATRARDLGLPALELQTRIELRENHATFAALGFAEVARTAHAGYDRPTSITFRRPLFPAPALA